MGQAGWVGEREESVLHLMGIERGSVHASGLGNPCSIRLFISRPDVENLDKHHPSE